MDKMQENPLSSCMNPSDEYQSVPKSETREFTANVYDEDKKQRKFSLQNFRFSSMKLTKKQIQENLYQETKSNMGDIKDETNQGGLHRRRAAIDCEKDDSILKKLADHPVKSRDVQEEIDEALYALDARNKSQDRRGAVACHKYSA